MTPRFLAWQVHGAIDWGKRHRKKNEFGGHGELEVYMTTLR